MTININDQHHNCSLKFKRLCFKAAVLLTCLFALWLALNRGAGLVPIAQAMTPMGFPARSFSVSTENQNSMDSVSLEPAQFGCAYQLSRNTFNDIPGSGITLEIDVTAGPLCPWTTVSNVSWIKVYSAPLQSGNGRINLYAESNANVAARTGTVTIAGKVVTVTQNGIPCTYPELNRNYLIPATGEHVATPVYVWLHCTWSATSNSNWIVITSSPSGPGTFYLTFDIKQNNNPGSRSGKITGPGFTITVDQLGACPAITMSPVNLPDATVGTAYSQILSASGGTAPYQFSSYKSKLPPGLEVNGNTLSGKPTNTGTYTFAIAAMDANGCQGIRSYALTINPNTCSTITLTPASLPAGTIGAAFTQSLFASGGTAPYQFNLGAGNLPAGLTLNSGGVLSGTPTEPGIADFTVKATDTKGCQGTRQYSLTIAPTSIVSVSAASYLPGTAPDSIVAAFGVKLTTETQVATTQPLPTTLANVSVRVKDNFGVERLAPLFFVSPGQINYQVPSGTALGAASVSVSKDNALVASGMLDITSVAPGLFTANSNGQGAAAAVVLRIKGNGSQSYEPVAQLKNNQYVTMPIDLGPSSDQVFLVLYGTGIRYRQNLSVVLTTLGGDSAGEVFYAAAAPGFVGLDQLNVRIPRTLIGRNEIDVTLMVEGKAANVVRVNIK